jgi:hypothetical protein
MPPKGWYDKDDPPPEITVAESLTWCTLSMRVFPFFCFPGLYRGMLLIDGIFSAIFTYPPDCDEKKIVRISPFPFLPAVDIAPSFTEMFSLIDIFHTVRKDQIIRQLEIGYLSTQRKHELLKSRGLEEKKETNEFRRETATLQNLLEIAEEKMEEFIRSDKTKAFWNR